MKRLGSVVMQSANGGVVGMVVRLGLHLNKGLSRERVVNGM